MKIKFKITNKLVIDSDRLWNIDNDKTIDVNQTFFRMFVKSLELKCTHDIPEFVEMLECFVWDDLKLYDLKIVTDETGTFLSVEKHNNEIVEILDRVYRKFVGREPIDNKTTLEIVEMFRDTIKSYHENHDFEYELTSFFEFRPYVPELIMYRYPTGIIGCSAILMLYFLVKYMPEATPVIYGKHRKLKEIEKIYTDLGFGSIEKYYKE